MSKTSGFFCLCAFFIAAIVVVAGCETVPKHANQLGSTHVAVLSVTDWQDYRAALSPTFNLTEAQALEAAVPDSRTVENAVLDAFRLQIAARIAPSDVLTEGFGAPTAPAGSAEGTPASQPGITAAGAGSPTPSLQDDTPGLASDSVPSVETASKLKGDAFLKFMAASALFQEVKLLERYVLDAVHNDDYQPYIVRLQVTNQPFADAYGYDTYANLAFFCNRVETEPSMTLKILWKNLWKFEAEIEKKELEIKDVKDVLEKLEQQSRTPATAPDTAPADPSSVTGTVDQTSGPETAPAVQQIEAKRLELERLKSKLDELKAKYVQVWKSIQLEQHRQTQLEPRLPIVVPLLVTDQVEAALLAGRAEELRQTALILAAAYAGIGGEATLEKVDQAIQKASGRSYRSLFTVGRLANNMLRVRMAARTVPDAEVKGRGYRYETMARNHFVTVLVLVPRDKDQKQDPSDLEWPQRVYLSARYEYRWPETGRPIGPAPHTQGDGDAVKKRALTFIRQGGYGDLSTKVKASDTAHEMAVLAQGNRYKPFLKLSRLTVGNDRSKTDDAGKLIPAEPGFVDPDTGQAKIDPTARRLYMDLNVAKLGTNFDSTDFQVVMTEEIEPSFGASAAYLVDNGQVTEAVIDGVKGIDPARVSATWSGFQIIDDTDPISLASTGIETRGASQLAVRFPSLVKLKVRKPGETLIDKGEIALRHPGAADGNATVMAYLTPAAPKPVVAMAMGREIEQFPSNTDKLSITFSLSQPALKLIKGIDINETDPPAGQRAAHYLVKFEGVQAESEDQAIAKLVTMDGKSFFAIKKNGRVEFKLSGLTVGQAVTVSVTPAKGGQPVESLKFDVIAPPTP